MSRRTQPNQRGYNRGSKSTNQQTGTFCQRIQRKEHKFIGRSIETKRNTFWFRKTKQWIYYADKSFKKWSQQYFRTKWLRKKIIFEARQRAWTQNITTWVEDRRLRRRKTSDNRRIKWETCFTKDTLWILITRCTQTHLRNGRNQSQLQRIDLAKKFVTRSAIIVSELKWENIRVGSLDTNAKRKATSTRNRD